jgi:fatty-acyl-CoA synthase
MLSKGSDTQSTGDLQDAVMIVYTSGTTGQPKGSVLTQNALFYNALNSLAAHDMRSDDHILTVLPMFHVGGMNIQTTPALYVGATVTLHDRFEPTNFLTTVATEKPTMTLLVPAAMQAVSSHPDWGQTDLTSLKLLGTGSSTVPEASIRPWQGRDIPVTQIYGLTESAPVAICLSVADSLRSTGSCGKAAVHCEAKITLEDGNEAGPMEKGEILLRGPNILREYWQDPEKTEAAFSDGWFHTGDIGHRDEEGFFYVDDRKKDVVISGGENIYPAELENILADCDALSEWAIVGEDDPRWVEIAVACVVPKEGREIEAEAILALFQDRLARYKHPKKVYFFEHLPRTALGKVQKFELKAMLAQR